MEGVLHNGKAFPNLSIIITEGWIFLGFSGKGLDQGFTAFHFFSFLFLFFFSASQIEERMTSSSEVKYFPKRFCLARNGSHLLLGFVSFFCCCCCAHNRQQRLCFRVSLSPPPPPPPPTLLLFLCLFPARVTGRREGRKEGRNRRGCALLLCLGATTMAGDHGNVHVVNSKQLWETKIEDAKSRGKIVSESLLSLSLSLSQSNFQLPVLVHMSSDKKTNL